MAAATVLSSGSAGAAPDRSGRPPPRPARVWITRHPAAAEVPGKPPPLPWPPTGQAAVSIPSLGFQEQSGPELPVPVASLVKIMTGYVILRDHPIGGSGQGPTLTVTPEDVAGFDQDVVENLTSLQVVVGEQLTERQLLEGALVHSAANYADMLARWDAGSVPAFVTKMNATAATLGMRATHYTDTSGYEPPPGGGPPSLSTAADQLRVTAAAMTLPAFAAIVDLPEVTLPVSGPAISYTPFIGTPEVIGVKSGFTQAAGGCDVLASVQRLGAHRSHGQTVGGHPALVLAAVTGQHVPNVLPATAYEALAVARSAAAGTRRLRVVAAGRAVAAYSTSSSHGVAVTARSASLLGWPGQRARVWVAPPRRVPAVSLHPGTVLTTVEAVLGTQRRSVPVEVPGDGPKRSG